MPGGAAAELAALLVERREVEQVAPRLLEMEAHDLLELELAAAIPVHALAPAGEAGVQGRADPLRQAVVRRVPHEDVVEAVDVLAPFLGLTDEAARLDPADVRAHRDERRGDQQLRDGALGIAVARNRGIGGSAGLFERAGGFDEQLVLHEDYDLWLRLALRSPTKLVHRPLTRVRRHDQHFSRSGIPPVAEHGAGVEKLQPLLSEAQQLQILRSERARLAARPRLGPWRHRPPGCRARHAGARLGATRGDRGRGTWADPSRCCARSCRTRS